MFENYTFEYLLDRMIERIKALDSGVDTSEGSLVYSILAPEAWELAEAYINISTVYDITFADIESKRKGPATKASYARNITRTI